MTGGPAGSLATLGKDWEAKRVDETGTSMVSNLLMMGGLSSGFLFRAAVPRVALSVDTDRGDPCNGVPEGVEMVENADAGGVQFIRCK